MWSKILGLNNGDDLQIRKKRRTTRRTIATDDSPSLLRRRSDRSKDVELARTASRRSVSFAEQSYIESPERLSHGKNQPDDHSLETDRSYPRETVPYHGDLISNVPNQFPNQTPLYHAQPYRPPLASHQSFGEAAAYYGDQGESVASQPGIRPRTPVIMDAEPHLKPASAVYAPPVETGSGSAAEFYGMSYAQEATNTATQTADFPSIIQPSGPSFHQPSSQRPNLQQHISLEQSEFQALPGQSSGDKFQSRIFTASQRKPIRKFMDWWHDYEDVRKMEEYTEYIGVCHNCFDSDSPLDNTPRKHGSKQRAGRRSCKHSPRGSLQRRSSTESESDKGLGKRQSSIAAGLGLATAASFLTGRGASSDAEKIRHSRVKKHSARLEEGETLSIHPVDSVAPQRQAGNYETAENRVHQHMPPNRAYSPRQQALGGREIVTGSQRLDNRLASHGLVGRIFPPISRKSKRKEANTKKATLATFDLDSLSSVDIHKTPTSARKSSERHRRSRIPRSELSSDGGGLSGIGAAAALYATFSNRRGLFAVRESRESLSQRVAASRKDRMQHPPKASRKNDDDGWQTASSDDRVSSSVDFDLAFGDFIHSDSGSDSSVFSAHEAAVKQPDQPNDLYGKHKSRPKSSVERVNKLHAPHQTRDVPRDDHATRPYFSTRRSSSSLELVHPIPMTEIKSFDAVFVEPLITALHEPQERNHSSHQIHSRPSQGNRYHHKPDVIRDSPNVFRPPHHENRRRSDEDSTMDVPSSPENVPRSGNDQLTSRDSKKTARSPDRDTHARASLCSTNTDHEVEFSHDAIQVFGKPSDAMILAKPPAIQTEQSQASYEVREANNWRNGEPIYDDELFDRDLFKRSKPIRRIDHVDEEAACIIADPQAQYTQGPVSMAQLFAPAELLQHGSQSVPILVPVVAEELWVGHANQPQPPVAPSHRYVPRLNIIAPTPPRSMVSFSPGAWMSSPTPPPRMVSSVLEDDQPVVHKQDTTQGALKLTTGNSDRDVFGEMQSITEDISDIYSGSLEGNDIVDVPGSFPEEFADPSFLYSTSTQGFVEGEIIESEDDAKFSATGTSPSHEPIVDAFELSSHKDTTQGVHVSYTAHVEVTDGREEIDPRSIELSVSTALHPRIEAVNTVEYSVLAEELELERVQDKARNIEATDPLSEVADEEQFGNAAVKTVNTNVLPENLRQDPTKTAEIFVNVEALSTNSLQDRVKEEIVDLSNMVVPSKNSAGGHDVPIVELAINMTNQGNDLDKDQTSVSAVKTFETSKRTNTSPIQLATASMQTSDVTKEPREPDDWAVSNRKKGKQGKKSQPLGELRYSNISQDDMAVKDDNRYDTSPKKESPVVIGEKQGSSKPSSPTLSRNQSGGKKSKKKNQVRIDRSEIDSTTFSGAAPDDKEWNMPPSGGRKAQRKSKREKQSNESSQAFSVDEWTATEGHATTDTGTTSQALPFKNEGLALPNRTTVLQPIQCNSGHDQNNSVALETKRELHSSAEWIAAALPSFRRVVNEDRMDSDLLYHETNMRSSLSVRQTPDHQPSSVSDLDSEPSIVKQGFEKEPTTFFAARSPFSDSSQNSCSDSVHENAHARLFEIDVSAKCITDQPADEGLPLMPYSQENDDRPNDAVVHEDSLDARLLMRKATGLAGDEARPLTHYSREHNLEADNEITAANASIDGVAQTKQAAGITTAKETSLLSSLANDSSPSDEVIVLTGKSLNTQPPSETTALAESETLPPVQNVATGRKADAELSVNTTLKVDKSSGFFDNELQPLLDHSRIIDLPGWHDKSCDEKVPPHNLEPIGSRSVEETPSTVFKDSLGMAAPFVAAALPAFVVTAGDDTGVLGAPVQKHAVIVGSNSSLEYDIVPTTSESTVPVPRQFATVKEKSESLVEGEHDDFPNGTSNNQPPRFNEGIFVAARLPKFSIPTEPEPALPLISALIFVNSGNNSTHSIQRQHLTRSSTESSPQSGTFARALNMSSVRRESIFDSSNPMSPSTAMRSHPITLQRSLSSTAVPLRFRRPPQSPTIVREVSNLSGSYTSSSPMSTCRIRHNRLGSSEFRKSTEFRPLYLVERNTKLPEPEACLPSLPSSRTTSRASSSHGNEDVFQSAAQSPEQESAQMFTPYEYPFDLTLDVQPTNENDEHYLDSGETTPKGISPQDSFDLDLEGLDGQRHLQIASPMRSPPRNTSSGCVPVLSPHHRKEPSNEELEAAISLSVSTMNDEFGPCTSALSPGVSTQRCSSPNLYHVFVDASPVTRQMQQVTSILKQSELEPQKPFVQRTVTDPVETALFPQYKSEALYHDQMVIMATARIAGLQHPGSFAQAVSDVQLLEPVTAGLTASELSGAEPKMAEISATLSHAVEPRAAEPSVRERSMHTAYDAAGGLNKRDETPNRVHPKSTQSPVHELEIDGAQDCSQETEPCSEKLHFEAVAQPLPESPSNDRDELEQNECMQWRGSQDEALPASEMDNIQEATLLGGASLLDAISQPLPESPVQEIDQPYVSRVMPSEQCRDDTQLVNEIGDLAEELNSTNEALLPNSIARSLPHSPDHNDDEPGLGEVAKKGDLEDEMLVLTKAESSGRDLGLINNAFLLVALEQPLPASPHDDNYERKDFEYYTSSASKGNGSREFDASRTRTLDTTAQSISASPSNDHQCFEPEPRPMKVSIHELCASTDRSELKPEDTTRSEESPLCIDLGLPENDGKARAMNHSDRTLDSPATVTNLTRGASPDLDEWSMPIRKSESSKSNKTRDKKSKKQKGATHGQRFVEGLHTSEADLSSMVETIRPVPEDSASLQNGNPEGDATSLVNTPELIVDESWDAAKSKKSQKKVRTQRRTADNLETDLKRGSVTSLLPTFSDVAVQQDGKEMTVENNVSDRSIPPVYQDWSTSTKKSKKNNKSRAIDSASDNIPQGKSKTLSEPFWSSTEIGAVPEAWNMPSKSKKKKWSKNIVYTLETANETELEESEKPCQEPKHVNHEGRSVFPEEVLDTVREKPPDVRAPYNPPTSQGPTVETGSNASASEKDENITTDTQSATEDHTASKSTSSQANTHNPHDDWVKEPVGDISSTPSAQEVIYPGNFVTTISPVDVFPQSTKTLVETPLTIRTKNVKSGKKGKKSKKASASNDDTWFENTASVRDSIIEQPAGYLDKSAGAAPVTDGALQTDPDQLWKTSRLQVGRLISAEDGRIAIPDQTNDTQDSPHRVSNDASGDTKNKYGQTNNASYLAEHQQAMEDAPSHESPLASSESLKSGLLGAVAKVIAAPLAMVGLVYPAALSANSSDLHETVEETRDDLRHMDDRRSEDSGRMSTSASAPLQIPLGSNPPGTSGASMANHETNYEHAEYACQNAENAALHLPGSYVAAAEELNAEEHTHVSGIERPSESDADEDVTELEIQKASTANADHAQPLLESPSGVVLDSIPVGLIQLPEKGYEIERREILAETSTGKLVRSVTEDVQIHHEIPFSQDNLISNFANSLVNLAHRGADQEDNELTIGMVNRESTAYINSASDRIVGPSFSDGEDHRPISSEAPGPKNNLDRNASSPAQSTGILRSSAAAGLHVFASLLGITTEDSLSTSGHLEDDQAPELLPARDHETVAIVEPETNVQPHDTTSSDADAHSGKPSSPSHERMKELDFRATLAAGLEHAGFHTDLRMHDPDSTRHRLSVVSDPRCTDIESGQNNTSNGRVITRRDPGTESSGRATLHALLEPGFDDIIEASLSAAGFEVDMEKLLPKQNDANFMQSQNPATATHQALEEISVGFYTRPVSPDGVIAAWNKGASSLPRTPQASIDKLDEPLNNQVENDKPQEDREENKYAESLSHAAVFLGRHVNLDVPRLASPVIPLKRSKARKAKKYSAMLNDPLSPDATSKPVTDLHATVTDDFIESEEQRLRSLILSDKLGDTPRMAGSPPRFDVIDNLSEEEKHIEMPGFYDNSPAAAPQHCEKSPALFAIGEDFNYDDSGSAISSVIHRPVAFLMDGGVRSLSASNIATRSGTTISPPPVLKGVRRVVSNNVLSKKPSSGGHNFTTRDTTETFSARLSPLETRRIASPASSVVSNRSGVLRRSDRSASGDLRAANRADKLRSAIQTPSPTDALLSRQLPDNYQPLKGTGRDRCSDMTDVDVPDVWRNSPRPQATPPTLRKWDSMQIIDLENRLDQMLAKNHCLQEMLKKGNQEQLIRDLESRDSLIYEKDSELKDIRTSVQMLKQDLLNVTKRNDELAVTNRTLSADTNGRYDVLQAEHDQTRVERANSETAVRQDFALALTHKDAEIHALQAELFDTKEQMQSLQQQVLVLKRSESFLQIRDEDYFDNACHRLCQHVQQWVLRFSKFSDMRACRLSSDLRGDEGIQKRLENAVLDGTDVDLYLSDRVKRRDVFMSIVMTMIWEFVFTRYLFGMDREQRSKLKSLEKSLGEVGPSKAVAQWRSITLTLLSRRSIFKEQKSQDIEAVVQEIYKTMTTLLSPPTDLTEQIQISLRYVIKVAVDLSIEMRIQRAEYIMLPPLQPEYDENGVLTRKVHFNAALMNERSGEADLNEELERRSAIVSVVLFPLVVKKGDDYGESDEEVVVCPAQVLVAKPGKDRKLVRVMSAVMSIDISTGNQSNSSTAQSSPSRSDVDM